MKFGIAPKLVILLTALVCITGTVLLRYLLHGAHDIVIAHELGDLSDETKLRAQELSSHLYAVRRVVGDVAGMPEWRQYLAQRDAASQTAVDELLLAQRTAGEDGHAWILRLDAWTGQPQQPETLRPVALPDEYQHVESLPLAEQIATHLVTLGAAGPNNPYLSNISSLDVQLRGGEGVRAVHAVWCGVVITPRVARAANSPAAAAADASGEDSPESLYLVALIDLDAPQPNGIDSPLVAIDASPRHLAVLANDPASAAVAPELVFIDRDNRNHFDLAPLEQSFSTLYGLRRTLTAADQVVQTMLPRARDTVELKNRVMLDEPLYFQQSEILSDPDMRNSAARKLLQMRAENLPQLRAVSFGGLANSVQNVRILARSKKDLAEARVLISQRLASPQGKSDPGIEIEWQKAVPCADCAMQYVLFPVRSAGSPDGRRFYGLAYGAFREEMSADVNQEFARVLWPALLMLGAAALLGFGASLVFTRPLKRITLAAQSFARTRLDPGPEHDQGRADLQGALDKLPVRRRDEIGVLARAFQTMIGEVLASHERLQTLNADLDRRVTERTEELQRANAELMVARDKAQEVSRAKDAFLASVSHELRNPLNQVSGFCQLLEMSELDEDQLADLNKIKLAGTQLLALINDILDYQKIVMGGITLEAEDFRVASLLREVQDAMAFAAAENQVDLQVSWSDDVGSMHADQRRLRQVLLNLVGNACKFSPGGQVRVRAERRSPANGRGDEVVIAVSDTGRGMTADEQAKLFKPFVKLAAKAGNRGGTGLGLVISKGFCELMGGDIRVSSEFGRGTTFTVSLPAGNTAHEPASTVAEIISSGQVAAESVTRLRDEEGLALGRRASHTVLVIDDDPDVRELMKRYLTSQGFRVETAANGLEGLQRCKELLPAVVTLDAVMPGVLDGWGVLAAMKADDATADIPVVMVTMLENEQRGQVMGAADFILKPVDWNRLSQVLRKYVPHPSAGSILVVDDDAEAREVLRRQLQHDSWEVLEAEHGAAALDLLKRETPAAILLDLMMPVMDGFEFLHEYMQSDELRSIPVIVVTAKDPTPDEYKLLNGLVARVLQKGHHTREELLSELHRRVDAHLATLPTPLGETRDG